MDAAPEPTAEQVVREHLLIAASAANAATLHLIEAAREPVEDAGAVERFIEGRA